MEEFETPKPPRVNYLNAEYGVKSWLLTKDHKRIALLYLGAISFFFSRIVWAIAKNRVPPYTMSTAAARLDRGSEIVDPPGGTTGRVSTARAPRKHPVPSRHP